MFVPKKTSCGFCGYTFITLKEEKWQPSSQPCIALGFLKLFSNIKMLWCRQPCRRFFKLRINTWLVMYKVLQGVKPKVFWRKNFFRKIARPRPIFTLLITCQRRLSMKDRLNKFGTITDGKCMYCGDYETCRHLFFELSKLKGFGVMSLLG